MTRLVFSLSVTSAVLIGGVSALVNGRSTDIRLVGDKPWRGRVEVFARGEWGTVCDDFINDNLKGADVICKSLGYAYGVASGRTVDSPAPDRIALDDVRCSGDEGSIFDCSSRSLFSHNCGHSEDYAVECRGKYTYLSGCGCDMF